jgi:hypothetical protein
MFGADGSNLFLCEFRAVMHYTLNLSAFLDFVFHIVGIRSNKQVVRSDASWIVAAVKHTHSRRHFSKVNSPRCTVRPDCPPARDGKFKLAIPFGVKAGGPHPAPVTFQNVTPKNLLHTHRFSAALSHINIVSLTTRGNQC